MGLALLVAAPAHAQTATEVSPTWPLIPAGLAEGDEFRLMLVVNSPMEATSTSIGTYDAHVQQVINDSGHASIVEYSDNFKVLASTAATNGRDHTGTDGDGGVPIYWIFGAQVASDYADFYDGTWTNKAKGRYQTGLLIMGPANPQHQIICTGMDGSGATTDNPLGVTADKRCTATQISLATHTLDGTTRNILDPMRYFALSGVFRVGAATVPLIAANGVAITSEPGADNEYVAGDHIDVTVTFSQPVTVASPTGDGLQIGLTLDGTDGEREADYLASESTPTDLVFRYTVTTSDYDLNGGPVVPADSLDLRGGTIQAGGVDAVLEFAELTKQGRHKVHIRPWAVGVNVVSQPASNGSYVTGETIRVGLTFNRPVRLHLARAWRLPYLDLEFDGRDVEAPSSDVSDDDMTVFFEYEVAPADHDSGGMKIDKFAFHDRNGNAAITRRDVDDSIARAVRALDMIPFTDTHYDHAVNKNRPVVNDVSITSAPAAADTYGAGETIEATVQFSTEVNVDITQGVPGLSMELRSAGNPVMHDVHLNYAAGSGTSALLFRYNIQSGDVDDNGVRIRENSLDLNGGTIRDDDRTDASADHALLRNQSGHKVDASLTTTGMGRGVRVSPTEFAVSEGASASYTVVLLSEPTGAVMVEPNAVGSPDVMVSEALTFTASDWSTAQSVTVSAAEDNDAETDSATVTHTVSGGDYGSATAADVTVTVTENERASTEVTLTASPASVGEADAVTEVTVTAALDGGSRDAETTVTVTVGGAGDSAVAGTDYATVNSFPITIPEDQLSGTGTFTLAPVDDTTHELDETLSVTGSTTATGLTVTGDTVTITDDDAPPTLSIDDVPVAEDAGTAEFTVMLDALSGAVVTVDYATADGTATARSDYTAAASSLIFGIGEMEKKVSVTIIDDTDEEVAETFTVNLTNASNASIGAGSGTGTIAANDATVATVPGAPTGLTAVADGRTAIGLAWTAPSGSGGAAITGYRIEVSIDGGANWNDLEADTGATDTTYEHSGLPASATRHYRVSARSAEGAGSTSGVVHATTEMAEVSLGAFDAPLDEAAGDVTVKVLLSNVSEVAVTVGYATSDGGGSGAAASSPGDYAETSDTLEIPADQTEAEFTVAVVDDELWEHQESFTVTLSSPSGATLGTGVREVAIADNDPAPTVSFKQTAYQVTEGTDEHVDLVIVKDAAVGRDVTIDFDVVDDPAQVLVDYEPPDDYFVMLPAGSLETTLQFEIVDDEDVERDERFKVTLADVAGNSGITFTDHIATVTIASDDTVAPDAPDNLAATLTAQNGVALAWDAPEGYYGKGAEVMGYRIEVSSDGGVTWSEVTANTGSTATVYTHTDALAPGERRRYRVSAINSAGTGLASNEARAGAPATDATLSGLTLSGVTLEPAFSPTTTEYTVSVANTVSRITITPTPNDSHASVTYVDDIDAAIPDVDPVTDGQQVDLVVGDNVIGVTVTAEDGSTTTTYTVTVTRETAAPKPSKVINWQFEDAPLPDGIYKPGSTFDIRLQFNKAVDVVGVPRVKIDLSRNISDERYLYIPYVASESTARKLVFVYEITGTVDDSEGQISLLRYSLELNGATIRNANSQVDADLKIPNVGTIPTLYLQTRLVEGIAVTSTPQVAAADSGGTDTYGPGETVDFTVTFSDTVNVNGTPILKVNAGSVVYDARYASGTGTTALRFEWMVPDSLAGASGMQIASNFNASFDLSTDSGLVLNGATLTDSGDRTVNIRHVPVELAERLDASPPVLWSDPAGATVNGTTLHLIYRTAAGSSDPDRLDRNSEPASGDFTVTVTDSNGMSTPHAVSDVDVVDDETVRLTLSEAVRHGDTVTLGYTPGTSPIQDLWGNDAAAIDGRAVRNDTAGSSDATLSALTLTDGDDNPIMLTPGFDTETKAYAASVANGVDRITVEPTRSDAGATVAYLNAGDVAIADADGAEDGMQVALAEYDNVIKVRVTAEDGVASETYTVTVTRGTPSTDATLSSLALSNGTLAPAFTSEVTSYSADVAADVTQTTVTATASDTNAGVAYLDGNDAALPDAEPNTPGHQVPLTEGANVIKVQVTAEDGSEQTYTVTVTRATPNTAPAFADGAATTRSFAETEGEETVTAAGDIGNAVSATDSEDDTLTYTLAGQDQGKYTIESSTGQLRTKVGGKYDHEEDASDEVTVTVDDGNGGTATIVVSLTIDDVDEPPLTMAAPALNAKTATTIAVGWTRPNNAGRPDLTKIHLQYRKHGSTDDWTKRDFASANEVEISGLEVAVAYAFQVRAENAEGLATWSASAIGSTASKAVPVSPGAPLVTAGTDDTTSLAVSWTAPDNGERPEISGYDLQYRKTTDTTWSNGPQDVTATATMASLTGLDASTTYAVQVRAQNTNGPSPWSPSGTGTTGTPSTDATLSSLALSNGTLAPAFTSAETSYSADVAADVTQTTVTATASDTNAGVAYLDGNDAALPDAEPNTPGHQVPLTEGANVIKVQVTAEDGSEQTYTVTVTRATPNTAPAFADGAATTRSFAETEGEETVTAAGDIGNAVSATDSEDDTLTYTLAGQDQGKYTIESSTGQLRTKVGGKYDHEEDASDEVTVTVDDGNGGTATIVVSLTIDDVDEPPLTMAAPALNAKTATTIAVGWTRPNNAGRPDLTKIHLQYRKHGSTDDWTKRDFASANEVEISGLEVAVAYAFQVRAENAEGLATWSASAIGSTASKAVPVSPGAPLVTAGTDDTTSLAVSWTAPDNGERPEISGYDLQYRKTTDTTWSNGPQDVTATATMASLTGLDASTTYAVQVRAQNTNGPSPWSPSGTGTTGTPSTDATLSSLALSNGTLAPAFTSAETSYSADVAADVTQTTVTATASDTNAGVAYLDGNDAALPDAEPNTPGHQVTLTEGANVIKVQVTAEDGSEQTYTVTVTRATPNTAPAFADGAATTRSFAETEGEETVTAAGDIGNAVSATDSEDDTLTYTLAGQDQGKYTIESSTGQLRTKVGGKYDHEEDASDEVTVTVDDGNGGTATIVVSLTIDDLDEPPLTMAAPALNAKTATTIAVSWTRPNNAGRPDLTKIHLQYRENGSTDDWTSKDFASADEVEISDLEVAVAYAFQVRAENAEGLATWSASAIGSTAEKAVPVSPAAPLVSAGTDDTTSLAVSWTAPDNGSRPATASYDLQYRKTTDTTWSDGPQDVTPTATTANLTGLDASTEYAVQVRAQNTNGPSPWSPSGTGTTGTPSTDATLSSLALSSGTLAPTFTSAETSYSADVAADVTQTTVTATASDTNASVAYLDGSDAALPDADPNTPGHQVTLTEGANVIKVQVTAEDGTTVRTYTVEVQRTSAATVQPTDCRDDAVWCTTLTVGVLSDLPTGYCAGAKDVGCGYGSMVDDDFTLDGTDYVVESVRWEVQTDTHLTLDKDFPADALARLTLWVGGESFVLSEAARGNAQNTVENNYRWSGVPESLVALDTGDTVTVQLVAATGWPQPAGLTFFGHIPERHVGPSKTFKIAVKLPAGASLGASWPPVMDDIFAVKGGEVAVTSVAVCDRISNNCLRSGDVIVGHMHLLRTTVHAFIRPGDMGDVTVMAGMTLDGSALPCAEADTGCIVVTVPGPSSRGDRGDAADGGFEAKPTRTPPGPAPLTARFAAVPPEHDGETPFTVEIVFNTAPNGIDNQALRRVIDVVGGEATRMRRVDLDKAHRRATIRPDGWGTVTVSLPATASCAAQDALCTAEGGRLDAPVTTQVLGPAALSVADAKVREGPDAVLDFAVTLDRAASGTVTVDYATADYTAIAGADYTAANGTLTFAPGETSKTVVVQVLDDVHDEGSETLTLTLSNASGARIADASATGMIVNADAMPRAWLARFGRTVAEQVVEAAGDRLRAPPPAGVEVWVAGQRIEATPARHGDGDARLESLPRWLWNEIDEDRDSRAGGREVTARDLLTGSSLALAVENDGGGVAGLWGRGAVSRFEGRAQTPDGVLSFDGEVAAAILGTDWTHGALTAGVMIAHARGSGSYRGADKGKVESILTGFYPYGRYALSERITLWGVAGFGAGILTLAPDGIAPIVTGIDLATAAAGLRGVLVKAPDGGGPELAAVTDGMAVRTSSAAVASRGDSASGNLAAAKADVTRLRLGLEGTWQGLTLGSGALTPRLEVGLRHDGGDAETGFGLDLGGGLAWSDQESGLAAELRARGLLTQEAGGFRDRGIAGSLTWDPRPDSNRGLKLTLRQTFGVPATGGMAARLSRDTLAGPAADDEDDLQQRSLEVRIDYGFPAFGDRFTATPEFELGLSDTERRYSVGWRLALEQSGPASLALNLQTTRREPANDDAEHSVVFGLTGRW